MEKHMINPELCKGSITHAHANRIYNRLNDMFIMIAVCREFVGTIRKCFYDRSQMASRLVVNVYTTARKRLYDCSQTSIRLHENDYTTARNDIFQQRTFVFCYFFVSLPNNTKFLND